MQGGGLATQVHQMLISTLLFVFISLAECGNYAYNDFILDFLPFLDISTVYNIRRLNLIDDQYLLLYRFDEVYSQLEKAISRNQYEFLLNLPIGFDYGHRTNRNGLGIVHLAGKYGRVDLLTALIKMKTVESSKFERDAYGWTILDYLYFHSPVTLEKILPLNSYFDFKSNVEVHSRYSSFAPPSVESAITLAQTKTIDLRAPWSSPFQPCLLCAILKISISQKVNADLVKILSLGYSLDFFCYLESTKLEIDLVKKFNRSIPILFMLARAAPSFTDETLAFISTLPFNPNLEDSTGRTALHVVTDIRMAELLIARGANINKQDNSNLPPIAYHIHIHDFLLLEYFLEDKNATPFDSVGNLIAQKYKTFGNFMLALSLRFFPEFTLSNNNEFTPLMAILEFFCRDDRILPELGRRFRNFLEVYRSQGHDYSDKDRKGNGISTRIFSPEAFRILLQHGLWEEESNGELLNSMCLNGPQFRNVLMQERQVDCSRVFK